MGTFLLLLDSISDVGLNWLFPPRRRDKKIKHGRGKTIMQEATQAVLDPRCVLIMELDPHNHAEGWGGAGRRGAWGVTIFTPWVLGL